MICQQLVFKVPSCTFPSCVADFEVFFLYVIKKQMLLPFILFFSEYINQIPCE